VGGERSSDCTVDRSKDESAIVGRGQGHLLRMPRLTSSPSVPYKKNRQEENSMSTAIAYTSVYEKRVGKTLRPEERQAMELHVADKPEIHPIVSGTGGVRKARWGRQGKGKRGGVRVIYFFRSTSDVVYFLDIYEKNEKEDLTPADKRELKELVSRLRGIQ
jgi:hypothetical protein